MIGPAVPFSILLYHLVRICVVKLVKVHELKRGTIRAFSSIFNLISQIHYNTTSSKL